MDMENCFPIGTVHACNFSRISQLRTAFATIALAAALSSANGQCLQSSQTAKLEPADAIKNDNLGQSVAISGSTLVAGANGVDGPGGVDSGAAYVYTLTNSQWTQQAKLIATDGGPDDLFGDSVAIDGDTVIVSASHALVGTQMDQGTVYIFVRTASTWIQQAKLVGSDSDSTDRFGRSVAISGNTVVIGSAKGTYVFVRTGNIWTQTTKFSVPSAMFGYSVAISQDRMIVGAPNETIAGFSAAGAAYVYRRTGGEAGTWSLQTKLTAINPNTSLNFGKSVSIDGGWAIVGAPGYATASGSYLGTAYFFREQTGGWVQTQRLSGGSMPFENQGGAVAISNLTAAIGAVSAQQNAYPQSGLVRIYKFVEGSWNYRATSWVSNPRPYARVGTSVSVSGQTAAIGATGGGSNPLTSSAGAVYIFDFAACCRTDFNVDTVVDDFDFVFFASSYEIYDCSDSSMPINCPADLNADGHVDDFDFSIFVQAYQRYVCP